MTRLVHWFSAVLFLLALAGIGMLLVFDTVNRLEYTTAHQRTGALTFMLIGASYIALQLGFERPFRERRKELALGIAFFLWGCEQFLPAGPWVTVMDSAVVLIFVTDLSLIIVERLRLKSNETVLRVRKESEPS